ncbi:MAG TPA: response regulator [Fredinandcohnia sp.]|nr:response regulator [Fredinandcohnia sp.]
MPGKYYTTFEASRLLGVSLPTVVNWIKANRLKAHKTPGGHRRIAREDLLAFLRRYEIPIPRELAPTVGDRIRVLAVDDDPDERELLRVVLEGEGFDVVLAENGFEAGLLCGLARPDAVILDLRMPGLDGFGAIELLRSREDTSSIPVIACTAMADDKTRDKVIEAGFDAHIVKPYSPEDLVGKILQLLGLERGRSASAR